MRLLWIIVSGLSCAGLVLATSLGLAALSDAPSAPDARAVRLAFAQEQASTRKLLALICERDTRVERLLLELSGGATERDASREAEALARVLGGDVQLLVERGAELVELGASGRAPGPTWSLAGLRQARRARSALGGDDPMLLDACLAVHEQARLWIARSAPLAALLAEDHGAPAALRIAPSAGAGATPDEVARFPLVDDPVRALRVLAPRASRNEDATALKFVAALGALGLLLGAGLAYVSTRGRAADETVLTAIERAAERVARGDLGSQIGLRLGGRADQTFQTFDRMTAELRETRAKLAEAERAAAWQDMARRIAHEIKNPLSPIKVALETLRKAHQKRLPSFDEIFDESTRAMLEEVARMEHILHEFNQFARLPKARPGALDLARLVQETAALYAPGDVSVEVRTDPELPVHADREQLAQVLVNLVTNAVDAARSASAPRVQVGARRAGAQVELCVEDNGPGVPEHERERIFEPYVTNKPEGTGLGLSIVRRIVLDHGGSIAVDGSALGGARFTVRLPAQRS